MKPEIDQEFKKFVIGIFLSMMTLSVQAQCVGLTDLEQRKIVVDYIKKVKDKIYPFINYDQKSINNLSMVGLTITYTPLDGRIINYVVVSQNKENTEDAFFHATLKVVNEGLKDKQLPQGFQKLCSPADRETYTLRTRFVSNKENFIE
jgi:predicted trehalose synthase